MGCKPLKRVMEACKAFLKLNGNKPSSAKVEVSLSVGIKDGFSDATVPSGRVASQWINISS